MIFRAGIDHKGAVDLLAEDDPHELVRKGHARKGEQKIRLPFDLFAKPTGRTDDEGDLPARIAIPFDLRGELLAGKRFPFHGQNVDAAAQLFYNRLSFFFQRAPFGKFPHGNLCKTGKTLAILRHRIGIKLLFEFADANNIQLMQFQPPNPEARLKIHIRPHRMIPGRAV